MCSGTDFVCPVADIIATQCQGPKDCLYPNPNGDCTTFIHCEVNADGITGNPVVKDCPLFDARGNKLEWNDNEKQCDYPPSPTCGNNVNTTLDELEGNEVKDTLGGL